jgi:LacI family transcriptional regulator
VGGHRQVREVSVRDVASRAGLSIGTVSNVLNRRGNVAPDNIERVNAAIAELGYVRNGAARQLRSGETDTLILVVPDLQNPFFAEIAYGANARAVEDGLAVIVNNSSDSEEREQLAVALALEQRPRGVLFSPVGAGASSIDELVGQGIRTILMGGSASEVRIPSIKTDEVFGGALAAQHLVDCGRTRIGFVGMAVGLQYVTDRLNGARSVVAHSDAKLEIFTTGGLTVDEGIRVADEIADLPAELRPDALFAANDVVGFGLLQGLARRGIAVPDEIAVIGYDDNLFAELLAVPLSSVRQSGQRMGRLAVELLLAAGDPAAPEHVALRPELVERASSVKAES